MPGAAAFLRDLRKSYPLSLATLASSPKGTPLRYAGNFAATAKSRPLEEGGCERSEQTEGASPSAPPTGCIQTDISIYCI